MNRKVLWNTLLVLFVMFIFMNSMQPSVDSSRQSGFVLQIAKQVLAAVGLEKIGITEHFIRKAAHFTEYAVMGMLLYQSLRYHGYKGSRWVMMTVLIGFLVPFTDETIQLFVEGRSGQISDVWLDCAGTACGNFAMIGWSRLALKKRGKEIG